MTGITDGQKKAMGDIMKALDGIDAGAITGGEPAPAAINESNDMEKNLDWSEFESSPESQARIEAPNYGISGSSEQEANVAAMRNILNVFKDATEHVREDSLSNPALMEALSTKKTERGVSIAEWEIQIFEKKGHGKYYDVVCESMTIASDLRLYEAALLLTQELNRGSSITSETVRHILALEAHYARNLDDAIRYMHIMKKTSGAKREIAQTRLTEAKAKAIAAKEQINEIR